MQMGSKPGCYIAEENIRHSRSKRSTHLPQTNYGHARHYSRKIKPPLDNGGKIIQKKL